MSHTLICTVILLGFQIDTTWCSVNGDEAGSLQETESLQASQQQRSKEFKAAYEYLGTHTRARAREHAHTNTQMQIYGRQHARARAHTHAHAHGLIRMQARAHLRADKFDFENGLVVTKTFSEMTFLHIQIRFWILWIPVSIGK